MRKNFGTKTWMYPMPVLIVAAYDQNGEVNAMNAAWGGISRADQIGITINHGHKTTKNIIKSQAFTVSIANAENYVACDYLGVVSGTYEPEKMKRSGFHTTRSEFVNAPIIEELPMTIECRVVSYDENIDRLVGEIVNISADESILDEEGMIDPNKLDPITFDSIHGVYRKLGEVVGKAFEAGNALK